MGRNQKGRHLAIYDVYVSDNYSGPDPRNISRGLTFSDLNDALRYCQQIVHSFLQEEIRSTPDIGSAALWERYADCGEDPYIVARDGTPVSFNGWYYAKTLCKELTADAQEMTDGPSKISDPPQSFQRSS